MLRNRIIYIILILLILTVTIYTTDSAAYLMLYSLILLPIVSLIFCLIKKKRCGITQSLSESIIEKGKETKLYIHGIKKCKYHTHKGIEYTPIGDYISVKGIERGKYKIGIKSTGQNDWLNLFRIYKRIESDLNLEVIPKCIPISGLPIDDNNNTGKNGIQQDRSDIIGLAEYHRQESLRDIHWKATVKKGELIVKKYNTSSEKEINFIVLNLNITEDFIDALYSCLVYLHEYSINFYYIDNSEWKCVTDGSPQEMIYKLNSAETVPQWNANILSRRTTLLLKPESNFTITNAKVIEFNDINEFIRKYGKN